MNQQESELPRHWRFALGQALNGIERLVWAFDFEAEAGKHAYANVPTPDEIIEIIGGFLSEKNLLYGGDVARLKCLSDVLEKQIAEAYKAGQEAVVEKWEKAFPNERSKLVERTSEEIRDLARRIAPPEAYRANWFVQGYCRRWSEEAFNQMVHEVRQSHEIKE